MKLFGNKSRKNSRIATRRQRKESEAAKKASAAAASTAASDGKKHRLTGKQRGLVILAAVLVCVVGVGFAFAKTFIKPPDVGSTDATDVSLDGAAWTAPVRTTTEVTTDPETGEETEIEVDVPVERDSNHYNFLILGTDKSQSNTDTILIASINTDTDEVSLMSVPRDTLIDASYSVPKINAAYSYGGSGDEGIANLENKLANLLGFKVDGYMVVDLDAFVDIVDLVGGVDFDVPMDMYYVDPDQDLYIDLKAGEQHLDGAHAIQLVRYRHGYATADLQRMYVQQEFLRALMEKCLQIGNLTKVKDFIDIFSQYVKTDLTVGNMVYFASVLLKDNFSADNLNTVTLPGYGVTIHGGSYYALYGQSVVDLVNERFNPYDTEITLDDVDIITVSNGVKVESTGTGSSYDGSQYDYGTKTYTGSTSGNATTGKTVSSSSSGSSSSSSKKSSSSGSSHSSSSSSSSSGSSSGSSSSASSGSSTGTAKPAASPASTAAPSAASTGTSVSPSGSATPSGSVTPSGSAAATETASPSASASATTSPTVSTQTPSASTTAVAGTTTPETATAGTSASTGATVSGASETAEATETTIIVTAAG